MTDRETAAFATFSANVRETRAHFAARVEALFENWLSSDMEITTRDRMLAHLRAEEARFIAIETRIYRANCLGRVLA